MDRTNDSTCDLSPEALARSARRLRRRLPASERPMLPNAGPTRRGDDDRAFALHDQALAIGRRIGDPTVTAKALTGLARIALRRTGVDEARRLCHEALAITEGTADRTGRSNALHVLGVTAQMAGEVLEARKLMSERNALARETGNYATIGLHASNLP